MSSLQALRLEELQKLAHNFDIEITEETKKPEILKLLADASITYASYKKFLLDTKGSDEEEETVADAFKPTTCLLKMDRKNGSFEVGGYTFTREHPFALMTEDEAQQIISFYEGFRIASPAEAKSYYE